MSPNEIASLKEVAELLGVGKRVAARYVDRPDFPEPIDRLDVGRIWRIEDVERWGEANLLEYERDGKKIRGLRTGRPPKSAS
jgi:prophage regulatory protein